MNLLSRGIGLFLLASFVWVSNILAQGTPNKMRTDLIAPSPTAANLSKYGNVPVTLYTGSANINIPISNIKGHDLEVPISLTYNNNGFKPLEQIGWIGLGWSLQAGGVITRNIRGRSDDDTSLPTDRRYGALYPTILSRAETDQDFLRTTAESGLFDTEADIFSYNFGNYSGKFVVVNGQAYAFPTTKLKITGTGASGFTITTEDGDRYIFSQAEYTRQQNAAGAPFNMGTYVSAWYLTKISNASQTEEINFIYIAEDELPQRGYSTQTYIKANDYSKPSTLGSITSPMPTFVKPVRLSQIISEQYTVNFTPEGAARLDVNESQSYALSTISVFNDKNQLLKSFKLNHEYFGNVSSPGSCYLKLKSLEQNAVDNGEESKKMIHKFDYYFENEVFPDRNSTGVDHYGYYNNTANGASLLIPGLVNFGDHTYTYYEGGANREPNESGAKLGILKKVTYPTGGSTEFVYEGNRTSAPGFKAINKTAGLSINRPGASTTNIIEQTGYFHVNEPQVVQFHVERVPKSPAAGAAAKDNISAELSIQKVFDDVYTVIGSLKVVENATQSYNAQFQLDTGTYILKLLCDASENSTSCSATYYERTNEPNYLPGLGLRIKSIADSSLIGPPLLKSYYYDNGNGPFPNYSGSGYAEITISQGTPGGNAATTTYTYTVINSVNAQVENQGLQFYYPKVTEEIGIGTDVTRSVYNFQSFESSASFAGAKLTKQTDYKKQGSVYLPVKEKTITYKSIPDGSYGFVSIRPRVQSKTIITGSTIGDGDIKYGYEGSTLNANWIEEQSVKEINYEADTLVTELKNIYNRQTHNIALKRTSRSDGRTIIQKNKYPEDYNTSIAGNLLAAYVINPVIESQTWLKKTTTDSTLIAGEITKYDSILFKPTIKYLLESSGPKNSLSNESKDAAGKFTNLISDNEYKSRFNYVYDNAGRLIRQHYTGGPITSYIWGYLSGVGGAQQKFNYPIAEIKNALTTEVFYESFEDLTAATTGAAHGGVKFKAGSYTVNWVRPNSRKYSISYWYRTGGVWKFKAPQSYAVSSLALSGGDAYDDIIISPIDAEVSTYNYFPGLGYSSVTDSKGQSSFFEYDEFQQLKNIRDQNGNIVSNFQYNLINPPVVTYPNQAKTGTFTKACSVGIGSSVTYTVAAGTYFALTQAAADAQAQADVNANGQAYANANGTCVQNNIPIIYTNNTVGARITRLKFKDNTGNVIYDFSETQLKSGVSVLSGIYTVEVTTSGSPYDPTTDKGWNSFLFYLPGSPSQNYAQDNLGSTTTNYTINNFNANTATQIQIEITKVAM